MNLFRAAVRKVLRAATLPLRNPTKEDSMHDQQREFIGLTAGVDCHGHPVRLGEFDSSGHIVGYIDEDEGQCWESLRERDSSITAGRYEEAVIAYRRGERLDEPDADAFARELCRDPSNWGHAAAEARDQLAFYDSLRRVLPKVRAELKPNREGLGQFLSWASQQGLELSSAAELRAALKRFREEEQA